MKPIVATAVAAAGIGLVGAAGAAARVPVAKAPGLVVSEQSRIYVNGRVVARGTEPAWSPDGRRIAFVRDGAIHTVRADGSGERRVTALPADPGRPATSPAWSPDGTRIAFSDTRDLLAVSLAGGKLTRLARSAKPWLGHFTPAWSPDGRQIAFSRSTDAFNTDIFVMNADGTRLRRLTRTQGTDAVMGEEHGPAWSPDGKTIVFVSNRDPRSWELWSIGANGAGERRITRTTAPGNDESAPRFSRDGKRLLHVANGRVATIGLDGSGRRVLGAGTSADWR